MNTKRLIAPLVLCIATPAIALAAMPASLTPITHPIPIPIPVATSTGPTVAQWQSQYAATTQTTTFRIPSDMTGIAPLVPGQQVTAKYVPYASPIAVTKNNAFGLLSTLLVNAQANEALGFTAIPVANTASQHPQWESDGTTINSCDEYVYKKYYDYRRFQDAAATCGGSPDCVYNVWALPSVPGESFSPMMPNSGVAWDMSPYPTSTLDPDPFVQAQSGTQQQLKNPFRDPNNVSQFIQALAYANSGTGSTSVTNYGIVEGYLQSAAFTASSPYYTISGARMPWHTQMHDQQAKYGMNMLDRAKIKQRIATMQSLLGAYVAAHAQDTANYEAWESRVIALCGGLVTPVPGQHPCTPTSPCGAPPPPPSQGCINARASDPGMPLSIASGTTLGDALIAEYQNVDRVTGAVDNGCLGVGHNKCDWSPTMIGQEYLTTLDAQAAADLSKCDSFFGTAPVSTLNATTTNLPAGDVPTNDEAFFDLALADAEGAALLTRASLNWSQTTSDTIRYDLFGGPQSWNVGGSVASANYSQEAYWEVKGEKPNGTLCRLAGRVYGAASAGGTVFGINFSLLDAELEVGVGETVAEDGPATDIPGYAYDSHITVAGDSLYSVSGGASAANFNDPIGNYNYTDTVLDVPGQISWLSLDLKVNVVANLTASISGTVAPACTASLTNPNNIQYALGTTLTPSVSAAAVGTALVGALGTGIGVQGTVDVLTVSLPVTVGSNVGLIPPPANSPAGTADSIGLTLNANASLDLNVLSGELDTAECVFGDCATQELFKWSGIPAFHDVLWSTSDQIPMIEMQNVFQ